MSHGVIASVSHSVHHFVLTVILNLNRLKQWFLTSGQRTPWGVVDRFQGVHGLINPLNFNGLIKKPTYYHITYSLSFYILKSVFEHNWFAL
jgi:hypothetical protein